MDYRGELFFSDLGIQWNKPPSQKPSLRRLDQSFLAKTLQPRKQTAHKGSHGRLLLVGGGVGMSGAIRLAAEAALRAGAGLVQVATHPANVEQVMEGRAEIMCLGITNPGDLNALANQADAVVLGPGLGGDSWAKGVWKQIMDSNWQRMVLDADGLNFLAQAPRVGGAKQDNWILTPHPGEAARLLSSFEGNEMSTAQIQAERLKHATNLAECYEGIVVLKGAGSLVAAPHSAYITSVCDFGNPGMATAGMGDVLSGIIGALCVQGNIAVDAACAGVLLHALAGDDAACSRPEGYLGGRFDAIHSKMGQPYLTLGLLSEPSLKACAAEMARVLSRQESAPLLIGLEGELGSGKTTWVRAMLRGAGFEGQVPSPTYALVEPYHLDELTIAHLDLYRLTCREDLDNLGIRTGSHRTELGY